MQRLQEQLRMTDAANKAEIKRLKDELATLRKVLKSYVQQSIHCTVSIPNCVKNEQITRQYQQTSRTPVR